MKKMEQLKEAMRNEVEQKSKKIAHNTAKAGSRGKGQGPRKKAQ
jgi:hypothetical protein